MSALAVQLGALSLRNPVLVASGTFGAGLEVVDSVDLSRIGGIVTKSVTTKPRSGNPPPRIAETAAGMLNSIGIMNLGVDGFRREVLPRFAELPTARIVNVAGESVADFVALCRAFSGERAVDAIELNVSCPNVSGGLDFGIQEGPLEELVRACRTVVEKPLIVKLTPNVTDVTVPARAAERAGADALSLTNTFLGMAVDWRRRLPRLGSPSGMGGLSGPAIKPLALAAVHRVFRAVKIPIVGIGGIAGPDDVMEFIVAGATAVQVGTQNFVDPGAAVSIVERLEDWVADGSVTTLPEHRGALRIPRPTHS